MLIPVHVVLMAVGMLIDGMVVVEGAVATSLAGSSPNLIFEYVCDISGAWVRC